MTLPANIRWVLFDAVGTLIYPDPPVAEVYRSIAERFGLQLATVAIRERFQAAFTAEFASAGEFERPPTSESQERARWQQVVAATLPELPDAGGEPFELLWKHFAKPSSWRLYDDVAPALEHLAARGYLLAIASNFDSRLHEILRGIAELAHCSRTFVSSEIGFSKPDPRFFAAVQSQLAESADQILLVGDDFVNDFQGAAAAGWHTLLVDRHATPTLPANRILRSLNELLRLQPS